MSSRAHLGKVERMGEPDDIASADGYFFMSNAAGFVTGQTRYVCGSTTLTRAGS
ncbi:hypothetical protein OAJ57_03930 [Alphaproteobacteria bacterium]|nr:hypothetical protein [Alphaproteobacteria bacterium]